MTPHSSTLAWKIPRTEEPGRLQSMRSLGVGHDFTFTFHFHALEKEMATHSSVLAWRIPGTGEPGGLQSMGSHRVGHNWRDLAAAAALSWGWEAVRLKAKGVYCHITQGQENVKPFLASAGWLTHFKRWYGVKNIKPEGEAGSVDQDAAKEFKSISKVLHRERVMWKSRFSMRMMLADLTRTLANEPLKVVFGLTKILWSEAHRRLTLYFSLER